MACITIPFLLVQQQTVVVERACASCKTHKKSAPYLGRALFYKVVVDLFTGEPLLPYNFPEYR